MQNELATLVARTREHHGLTQAELAQFLGLPRSAISKVETGDRRLSTDELLTLTQLFGDSFELGCDHILGELISDLAARLRTFLEAGKFTPDRFATKDWLTATLHKLDDTYVAGAA